MKRTREEFIAGRELLYRSSDGDPLIASMNRRNKYGLKELVIRSPVTNEVLYHALIDAGQAYDQITSSLKKDDPHKHPLEGR